MAAVKVIDNASVSLTYHPESKIVHHEFKAFVFGENFRSVLSQGVEVMRKNRATKWLSDDRMNSALTAEDTNWAQTVWFPEVSKAGWKHWAVVMPDKVIGQLNMKKWIGTYSALGINARAFSDPDAAMTWLAAQ